MNKIVSGLVVAVALVIVAFFAFKGALTHSGTGLAQENLRVSFTSYMTKMRGFKRIQLAEVSSIEIIERTSEYAIFWNTVKLPDVVVQARIPVRYIYYIDLEEPFDITLAGNELLVKAPKLRAATPAPDISAMNYEVKKGSLFRNTGTALEELRKSITPMLNESAETTRQLVGGEAKKQLEELIRTWMLQSSDLKNEVKSVKVSFNEGALK